MPSQGHLVCGVRCTSEDEIKQLYASLGVSITGASDPMDLPYISFRETQLDILERISPYSREELKKIVVDFGSSEIRGFRIAEMKFCPIGDMYEIGHNYPSDYVFGVELTSRYSPTLLDIHSPHGAGNGPCQINGEHLLIAREYIRKKIPAAEVYTIDLVH